MVVFRSRQLLLAGIRSGGRDFTVISSHSGDASTELETGKRSVIQ